jgi:hypothetical protein
MYTEFDAQRSEIRNETALSRFRTLIRPPAAAKVKQHFSIFVYRQNSRRSAAHVNPPNSYKYIHIISNHSLLNVHSSHVNIPRTIPRIQNCRRYGHFVQKISQFRTLNSPGSPGSPVPQIDPTSLFSVAISKVQHALSESVLTVSTTFKAAGILPLSGTVKRSGRMDI